VHEWDSSCAVKQSLGKAGFPTGFGMGAAFPRVP
jgi:hypothetical protein